MQLPLLSTAIQPFLLDLVTPTPLEENASLLIGLLAVVAGAALVYLVVRAKRSKKP